MSFSVEAYKTGGLRFWSQEEIEFRNLAIGYIKRRLVTALSRVNNAWNFRQIEGPIMTPRELVAPGYGLDDIYFLSTPDPFVLRPETTPSSYQYAGRLLNSHHPEKLRLPLCVWQAGKSFRVEKADGASPSKLRFNEFWQLEFQCLYSKDTKADYRSAAEDAVQAAIQLLTYTPARIVASDRLPEYSLETNDVEIEYNGRWTEMCSISTRKDFADDVLCLEVAVGLDRLTEVWRRCCVVNVAGD